MRYSIDEILTAVEDYAEAKVILALAGTDEYDSRTSEEKMRERVMQTKQQAQYYTELVEMVSNIIIDQLNAEANAKKVDDIPF